MGMVGDDVQSDSVPQELNFAIKGTMELTVSGEKLVCTDIRIAQGSNDYGNNWWVACSDGFVVSYAWLLEAPPRRQPGRRYTLHCPCEYAKGGNVKLAIETDEKAHNE